MTPEYSEGVTGRFAAVTSNAIPSCKSLVLYRRDGYGEFVDPDMENPGDDITITEATDAFELDGYDTQFCAVDGAMVMCFACHTASAARTVHLVAIERMEGASDPDDMIAVAAVVCPNCSAKGTLTLKYGPETSLEDQEVLAQLSDERQH